MLKKTGVWIDTKKAVLVFIEKKIYCFNFIFFNRSQGKNTRRGKMVHTVWQQLFTHAGGGGGCYWVKGIYSEMCLGGVLFFNRSGIKDERYLDKLDKYFIQTSGFSGYSSICIRGQ
jgi:hypothetical protein